MNQARDVGSESGHRPENLGAGSASDHRGVLLRRIGGRLGEGFGSVHLDRRAAAVPELDLLRVHRAGGTARRLVRCCAPSKIGLHILRAATGTAVLVRAVLAITQIPLANATLLTYSAPLWMPLIAWVVTRQPVARATWVGAGIGFVGVILVLQPQAVTPSAAASWPRSRARCPWPSR